MARIKPVTARISLKALRPAVRKALSGIRGKPVRDALRGRIEPRKPRGNRWGKVSEINYLLPIGGKLWRAQPKRLQHLHGFRADHAVVSNHNVVRSAARRLGVKPTSDLSVNQKVAFFQKRKE